MLEIQEEFPLEDWVQELAVLMKHVEGVKKREGYQRIMDNLAEFIFYYEAGLSPRQSFDRFWEDK